MRNISVLSAGVTLLLITCMATSVCFGQKTPPIINAPEGMPPSDAIVLFNGSDLSHWMYIDGKPAEWTVENGEMIIKGGSIVSREQFGDTQIHVEFCIPDLPAEQNKARGNSGIYIHQNYEIQIIDSYQNNAYGSGLNGAIYRQRIPLVNASRAPGVWQEYDIFFRAPRFGANTEVVKKANITVIHNGILIHDHVDIDGPTGAAKGNKEIAEGPILLQDHGSPVRYRNIWIRPLSLP